MALAGENQAFVGLLSQPLHQWRNAFDGKVECWQCC
jgi:hypothetical protein